MLAVAIVDEILDAADVETRSTRDCFDLFDDLARWMVTFDTKAGLRRVNGAGTTDELDAVGRLAGVGRAEVERSDRRKHLDGVEIISAECLNANDVAVAEWRRLLNQSDTVDGQVDLTARD